MPNNFQGNLQVNVTVENQLIPVENAIVTIYDTGEPDRIIEQTTTNSSGQTEFIPLPAPNVIIMHQHHTVTQTKTLNHLSFLALPSHTFRIYPLIN